MKKIISLILALVLVLCLAACGSTVEEEDTAEEGNEIEGELVPMEPEEEQEDENDASVEIIVEEEEEASGSDVVTADPPASATDAETSDAYTMALEYVGSSVEELYAAIGEPTGGTQYATSCLEEDAEDGMLFYDDFYVWSLRTDDEETVYAVYLLDED